MSLAFVLIKGICYIIGAESKLKANHLLGGLAGEAW